MKNYTEICEEIDKVIEMIPYQDNEQWLIHLSSEYFKTLGLSEKNNRYRNILCIEEKLMLTDLVYIDSLCFEIERLRSLQASRVRWFSQEEYDRLKYLAINQYPKSSPKADR